MHEPSIPEILRVSFEMTEEPLGFMVTWTDDKEGQARIIRTLAGMVKSPLLPHDMKVQAFDELERIARDYRERAEPGSVPIEMFSVAFAVFSGDVARPKRGKGRDPKKNLLRDRMIIDAVAWLQRRGETKTAAVKLVAEVVQGVLKARNPRLSFGPDGVEAVLRNGNPVERWKKEINAFLPP